MPSRTAGSTPTTAGPATPVPYGDRLTATCAALEPDWRVNPDLLITVHFNNGEFLPQSVRDRFAAEFGLREYRVTMGLKAWFMYEIVDGTPLEEKLRDVRASPLVEHAGGPDRSGGGEYYLLGREPDVVLAAATVAPEYDPDAVMPEVLVRFSRPMTSLELEIWTARRSFIHVGEEAGGWHRFCSDGVEPPWMLVVILEEDPLVQDVRFEVPEP